MQVSRTSIGRQQHVGAYALERAVSRLLLHHHRDGRIMDRASQVLAQGILPGVPESYRALVDYGSVPRSTFHHLARVRPSIEVMKSPNKSAIGKQKCHKSNYADSDGRTSDIYINDGISHQTDSNQLNHILKSNRIFNHSQFIQSVHNLLQEAKAQGQQYLEPCEEGVVVKYLLRTRTALSEGFGCKTKG